MSAAQADKEIKFALQEEQTTNTYYVLRAYRHLWLETLKESIGDPEFTTSNLYDHMVDGVLGFQSAMEHI